ncbi:MAG: sigma-70 family RNA polymerase sigma factor [Opitutus sp.]|nr:sigma-70 family RNA polymerase sigma factor [Opitutus sp.]
MIQPNTDLFAPGPHVHDSSPDAVECDGTASAASPMTPEKAALIALVRRAEAGEPAAQSELVHRYTRRVAGFVRAIIRQPDAEEDVTQIVFIKMFRRLNRLRDPAVFESWLFTLARNTGLDFIRRRRCRPSTVAIDEEVNQIADPSNSSATTEILAALDRALTRLTPIDRNLVTQFVAGDSYGEIAARAGLSLATVKVRLHRVRPFLRSWVGEMTDTRQPGGKGWRATAGSRASASWPTGSSLAA